MSQTTVYLDKTSIFKRTNTLIKNEFFNLRTYIIKIAKTIAVMDALEGVKAAPEFADEATAQADGSLAAGSFYKVTGSDALYQK